MTKTEFATMAAGRQGFSNTEFIAKAKEFAVLRMKLIWDAYLWRQSITVKTDQAVAADEQDVEIDDTTMEFVVALRFDDNLLDPMDHETVLRIAAEAYDGSGDPGGFEHLEPSATGEPNIRLFRTPDAAGTLLVIAKKLLATWGDDGDPPRIPGLDNCLLSFIEHDLLQYQRQYGKAQMKLQEATALLEQMKTIEIGQRGRKRRLIPDPYEGGSYTYDAFVTK